MYSAAIAQYSSEYCRSYYLFRSLFPISCFLVSMCCFAHSYALTMRSYNLVIMFSVIFGPKYRTLNPNDLTYNILFYDFHKNKKLWIPPRYNYRDFYVLFPLELFHEMLEPPIEFMSCDKSNSWPMRSHRLLQG